MYDFLVLIQGPYRRKTIIGFILASYMISLVSFKDQIWFFWTHIRIIHFFKNFFRFTIGSSMISWILYYGVIWKLWFHTRIIYDFFGSYKDHIRFIWSHTRIIHFLKRVILLSWMVHLLFRGFHARIKYENLDFIKGSNMIFLVSY